MSDRISATPRGPSYSHCINVFSKDALCSIIISQRLLGTREVAVFHHTDCGVVTFNTPQLRDIVKNASPGVDDIDNIDFLEFSDIDGAVHADVEFLKKNPLVLPETIVTGWVYEVETGRVRVPEELREAPSTDKLDDIRSGRWLSWNHCRQ